MEAAPAPQVKPFIIGWLLFFVLVLFVEVALIRHNYVLDFRLFYVAGYQVRTHPTHLYDLAEQYRLQNLIGSKNTRFLPFYHPPYEAVLLVPFTFLKIRRAIFAYIAFNMLLLMAAVFVARRAFISVPPIRRPRSDLTLFIFLPLFSALFLGQDSVITLFLCCLAWRQIESGKDFSAGCILALALFKFQIVIPLALILAINRGRRFFLGFLVSSLGVLLLCLAIVGPAGLAHLFHLLIGDSRLISQSNHEGLNIVEWPRAMPNFVGLLTDCAARLSLSHKFLNLLIAVSSALLFAWSAFAVRRREPKIAFSIAILCGLLVSFHLYGYDQTLCLLPMALLDTKGYRYITAVMLLLPLVLVPFSPTRGNLMALPVLAMLAWAIAFTPKAPLSTPEPLHLSALP